MSDLRKFINILNESYTAPASRVINEGVEGETLGVIAKKHLKINSLLAKGDVNHDVAISSLKKAMEEAYDAGYGAGTNKKEKENKTLSEGVEGETISVIAKRHLGISTLETRNDERKDFYDLAVWTIKKALEEAYDAGYGAGINKKEKEDKKK